MTPLRYNPKVPEHFNDDVDILDSLLADQDYFFIERYQLYLAWLHFSNERCAGWLIENEDNVKEFIEWLKGGYR